ncbi:hypothetical protein DYB34_000198 [Aphanomyces astaci]|uniref:Uncharacterized protein n=1 Tax=Aphanomyces astaci TaxID=112090 RepID=A0A3R6ZT67_APHAT|nr:hypothetical protein DYB34_000198 [Aphanomyces astaci]
MKPPIKSQSDMTGTIAESPRSFALSTMPTMALRKLHAMRDLAKLPFTVEPSCSPLHAAVLHGHVDRVIRYIASAPLLVHAVDRVGDNSNCLVNPWSNTRLHYAAACNKLNAVISILQDRMQNDVDVRNKVRLSVKHQREQISKATV